MQRHTRQIRLAGVGPEGQARIARAEVVVPGTGLSAEVAARYLAGAGVAAIVVQDERIAASARAMDAAVGVRVDAAVAAAADALPAPPELRDPAARELASGALLALSALRDALAATAGFTEEGR
jgi:hypothetical protein